MKKILCASVILLNFYTLLPANQSPPSENNSTEEVSLNLYQHESLEPQVFPIEWRR